MEEPGKDGLRLLVNDNNKSGFAGCQWLMPVILATQEAGIIRRIAV
jgi:hypothetical protein